MELRDDQLTACEVEIGGYLLRGFSVAEIAERIGISWMLIDAYTRSIREKLKTTDSIFLKQLINEHATEMNQGKRAPIRHSLTVYLPPTHHFLITRTTL